MPAKRKTLQDEVAEVMSTGVEPSVPATSSHEPVGLRPVTAEDLAADRAYIASLDEADGRLPAADGATAAGLGAATPDEPESAATEDAEAKPHGAVTALVKRLLSDPEMSYADIVERVKADHPGASTTARSVASVASVMRRSGASVPMRRK